MRGGSELAHNVAAGVDDDVKAPVDDELSVNRSLNGS